jgi:hypothetical protein
MIGGADAGTTSSVTWFDVAGVLVPLLAVLATVGLGVWTYWRQQQAKHRDELRALFSDALRAVADYQELPYLIRRRSDVSPMTRSDLTRHASDVQTRLDYFVTRLDLEAPAIGDAYRRLASATRREAGNQMTQAWAQPRLERDDEMPLGAAYTRESAEEERSLCLNVMQQYVSRRRRSTT